MNDAIHAEDAARVPVLPSGVRTKFDTVRGAWVLLAPERAIRLDDIGAAILAESDGARSVSEIVDRLVEKYNAPRDQIAGDVSAFLGSLAERRMLELR